MADKFDPKSKEYRDSVMAEALAQLGETTESAAESKEPPKESVKSEAEAVEPAKSTGKWAKSFKFKDELDDEVDFEVDEDSIEDVASKAFKFNAVTAELKAVQDEVKSLRKVKDETVSKAKKWLDLETSGNKLLLVEEILKDEGGIEGIRAKAIEEFKQISAMTEDERRDFEYKKAQLEATRKFQAEKANLEARAKELAAKEAKARDDEYKTMVKSIGNRYFTPNASNSQEIHAQNRAIHNEAMSFINAKKSEGITITESIVDRAYAKAVKLLKGDSKAVSKEVAKQTAKQIDAATGAVQAARGSGKGAETPEDTLNRWVKMVADGKQREVTREAGKSEELMNLYMKLPDRLAHK